jgi:aminobutyraldehyde dehydrogenase
MQTRLLIDGALVGGEGAIERILDPATGQCIAEVAEATLSQLNAAVAAAEAVPGNRMKSCSARYSARSCR